MVAPGEVVSKAELARRLNVDRRTIADMIRLHRVPMVRVGDSHGIDRRGYLELEPHLTPSMPLT
jgi:excisionase family DNA binding protein